MDFVAGGGDRPGQPGNDLADGAASSRGCERDHRFAAARGVRAANEVQLSSGSGELVAVDAFGVACSGQIHFHRGVDRDHVVVLGDESRIVDVVDRVAFQREVVVHQAVHRAVAHGEGEDRYAVVDGLGPAGGHTAADQVGKRGCEYLGVDA